MRHAAGELAHRLHLAGLGDLLLERLPGRDIDDIGDPLAFTRRRQEDLHRALGVEALGSVVRRVKILAASVEHARSHAADDAGVQWLDGGLPDVGIGHLHLHLTSTSTQGTRY